MANVGPLKQADERLINDDEDKFMLELQAKQAEAGDGLIDSNVDRQLAKQKKREAKKDLDFHQVTEFEPINKDLYIECREIAGMTQREVAAFRKGYGDIKVRGVGCPRPIHNWYQCGLPEAVLDLIEKKAFKKPFPIQCQGIPAAMSGRDVIGIAETGSGKTLAYVLPMIRHIRDQRPLEEGEGPVGLIIAPTRELVF